MERHLRYGSLSGARLYHDGDGGHGDSECAYGMDLFSSGMIFHRTFHFHQVSFRPGIHVLGRLLRFQVLSLEVFANLKANNFDNSNSLKFGTVMCSYFPFWGFSILPTFSPGIS